MNQKDIEEIRAKILEGIKLSYERLLIQKKKNNTKLVISRDGKILKVNARDFMKK